MSRRQKISGSKQKEQGRRGHQPSSPLQKHEPTSTARSVIVLLAATILCFLPFAGKAFHIDDPLFLWAGRQILESPMDPYGFPVNWYGTEMPMSAVTKNPPLTCYYIAVAALALGWSETALHLAFLIPAAAAILGAYFLARLLCARPLAAALACLFTPVFLVSGTTVMSDVMMLALWVWAAFLWISGFAHQRRLRLLAAALLMAIAPFVKYFAISLVPLLFVYSLYQRRRLGWWAAYFVIPAAAMLGYESATLLAYGTALFKDAGSYAQRVAQPTSWGTGLLVALAFAGGCIAIVFFYAPLLWSRRNLAAAALACLPLVMALTILKPLDYAGVQGTNSWLVAAQVGLFAIAGLGLIWMAVADFARRRDAGSLFLLAWLGGTFIFAWLLNWTINARSILPLLPAASILIMRRIEERASAPAGGRFPKTLLPLIPSAVVALAVAHADMQLADSARRAAHTICQRFTKPERTIWFQGHWGFQYYMEMRGAKAANIRQPGYGSGDVMVIPHGNTNLFPVPSEHVASREMIEIQASRYLAIMNEKIGAGFYSHRWGPVPYSFGLPGPERYEILHMKRPPSELSGK